MFEPEVYTFFENTYFKAKIYTRRRKNLKKILKSCTNREPPHLEHEKKFDFMAILPWNFY